MAQGVAPERRMRPRSRRQVDFAGVGRQHVAMTDCSHPRITSAILVLALVLAGCSSVPSRVRGPGEMAGAPSRVSPQQAEDVTIAAVGLVGTPYRYGGQYAGIRLRLQRTD